MNLDKLLPHNKHTFKSFVSFQRTPLNIFLFSVTLGLLGFLLYGTGMYLQHGHHAYGITRQHPWGLLIAMYVFFVVSSTGLCIMSSLGHVFNIKAFQIIGKRAIMGAIIAILTGFLVISYEIGHPIRMVIYNVLTPGLTSAIWWMGTLYGLYLTFIIIEFFFLNNNNHKLSKIFGLAGLIVGLAAHSNLGAVFGFLVARPIANGVFFPLYFILSAMVTGSYLLFLIYGWRYKMKFPPEVESFMITLAQVLGLLLGILMFFEIWRALTAVYGMMPERGDIALHMITSKNFLLGEVLLGMLIPFIIIVWSRGRAIKTMVYASITGMVGIFWMRYDLVHDTQLAPMMPLKIREYSLPPGLVEYTPTGVEWMISIGAIGISFLMYFAADKFFNLDHKDEKSQE
jgi:Ni/Fe-hydrogenase subunit HybB-like protein